MTNLILYYLCINEKLFLYVVIECQKAALVGYGSCTEATTAALRAAPYLFMAATVSELNI